MELVLLALLLAEGLLGFFPAGLQALEPGGDEVAQIVGGVGGGVGELVGGFLQRGLGLVDLLLELGLRGGLLLFGALDVLDRAMGTRKGLQET